MGVSGSGKSTVARALAEALGADHADADAFHDEGNLAKMRAGVPLDDADRVPWLRAVGDWLAARGPAGGVVACSALKRSYRDILRERGPRAWFLHLAGPPELAAARVGGREGHFMPASLVASQYAALEPLAEDEPGLTVGFARPLGQIVERALAALAARADRPEEGPAER